MLKKINWAERNDADNGFMVGYMLSQYQTASQHISLAVIVLSDKSAQAQTTQQVCSLADAALILLSTHDFSVYKKPELYFEMSAFIPPVNKDMIKEYLRLRQEINYTAFEANLEKMVQDAVAKLAPN